MFFLRGYPFFYNCEQAMVRIWMTRLGWNILRAETFRSLETGYPRATLEILHLINPLGISSPEHLNLASRGSA
jgi:hypothetical protein